MKILSEPTSDMLAMLRFDNGAIDMQELLRNLANVQLVQASIEYRKHHWRFRIYT